MKVVDASVAVALVVPLPWSQASQDLMGQWIVAGVDLPVPALWHYEVLSALQKFVVGGRFSGQAAEMLFADILGLGFVVAPPASALAPAILQWARRLEQPVAYDATYLAFAEQLEAEFWTADRKLHRLTSRLGLNWVHLVE